MEEKPTYEELEKRLLEVEEAAAALELARKLPLAEKKFTDYIIESLPGIFYLFDETGKFFLWNKYFEEISEYSAKEIAAMAPSDFFQGEDKKNIAQGISEVFSKGQASVEATFVSKSGKTKPFLFTGNILDIEGKKFVAGMGVDISARISAEEALSASETQYRSFFENNHAVMLLINPETGEVVDANPAAINFYGYLKEEITKIKIFDINTLTRDETLREMALAKAESRSYFNFKHRLAGGEVREVEVYSGPITVRDVTLLYSVIHDITERKLAAAEKENLINELRQALSEVKTLRGLIPICANCKNIRDDQGYWNQIEEYLSVHSEVAFTHGICPDCMKKLYPEIAGRLLSKQDDKT